MLSKGRAESVKQAFVARGVRVDRLKASGYADTRLLSGLRPTAPDHRRVELEFGDLDNSPGTTALVKELNALIAKYQSL
jgi:hypothetical protein